MSIINYVIELQNPEILNSITTDFNDLDCAVNYMNNYFMAKFHILDNYEINFILNDVHNSFFNRPMVYKFTKNNSLTSLRISTFN
jgi:hypothetical protein